MRLRAETGEVEEVLADWWQEFSMASDELRRDMVDQVREEQAHRPRLQRAPRPAGAAPQLQDGAPQRPGTALAQVGPVEQDGDLPSPSEAGPDGPRKRRRRRRAPGADRAAPQAGSPTENQ